MKVLIYGAGVIGQIFGGRLAQAGHDVSLLARGDQARSLAEHGLTLRKGDESVHISPSVITAVAELNHCTDPDANWIWPGCSGSARSCGTLIPWRRRRMPIERVHEGPSANVVLTI